MSSWSPKTARTAVRIGLGHVHGDGLQRGLAAFEGLQEGHQRSGILALLGVEDLAGLRV